MKMNKKIIVSTLALAMGAALAGSVSGTVAWFQYSTRAQASFIGASAHCSEALEIRAKTAANNGAWGTELNASAINAALGLTNGAELIPVTTGELKENAALPSTTTSDANGSHTTLDFYKNPIYQFTDYKKWGKAEASNYVSFDLEFHVKDIDGAAGTEQDPFKYLANHNLFLTDLSIVSLEKSENNNVVSYSDISSSTNDLYRALRVHLDAGDYHATFAAGEDDSEGLVEINTYGQLDLNNDGKLDTKSAYEWESTGDPLEYGKKTGQLTNNNKQSAYNVLKDGVLADDTDPSLLSAAENSTTKGTAGLIGAIQDAEVGLTVNVTIWIEGWQKLTGMQNGNYDKVTDGIDESAVWDPATYIAKHFGVGLRFATELHTVH